MTTEHVTRRDFIRTITAGAAALAAGRAMAAKAATTKRPNILFIMSDDHAAPAIGCYGSRINKTPNIDRLAAEGMRLDNCFCTNSICTPSRATIATGKYSHKNGCRGFNRFDGSQQTFPKLLQKAGYHTGMVGKWHLGSQPTGFDYWNVLPGQGKYFDPDMTEMGERRKYKGYVTDIITDVALKFLKQRPKDKPFCLMYHHKAPHDMFQYDEKHAKMYEDADIPEPPTLFDDYSNRGEAIKRVTQKIGMRHTTYGRQTKGLTGKARVKKCYQIYIKSYLRCVASIDDNLKRVLDYLDAEGLTQDTIVIYTADQGFYLGEHGMFDKRFMYEESLRMPFLVRYPREIKPGTASDAIVVNVDFAETFLDYAGVAVPKDMQGRSIRPILRGKTPADWPKSMYYRYWLHMPHFRVAAHFGVRTHEHKLIFYYGLSMGTPGARNTPTPPEWELFDLKKDPREMKNVFKDPAYADVVKKLGAELIRLRKLYEDDHDGIDVRAALEGKPAFDEKLTEPAKRSRRPVRGGPSKLTKSKLGHQLETFGGGSSHAAKKLAKTYRKKVTFQLKMQSALTGGTRNGILVFGCGTQWKDLMKCCVYIGAGALAIEQGTAGTQEGKVVNFNLDKGKAFDVKVEVDLAAGKVTMTLDNKTTVSAPLQANIKEVTHAGYACWSTTKTHFSEIDITGQ